MSHVRRASFDLAPKRFSCVNVRASYTFASPLAHKCKFLITIEAAITILVEISLFSEKF